MPFLIVIHSGACVAREVLSVLYVFGADNDYQVFPVFVIFNDATYINHITRNCEKKKTDTKKPNKKMMPSNLTSIIIVHVNSFFSSPFSNSLHTHKNMVQSIEDDKFQHL